MSLCQEIKNRCQKIKSLRDRLVLACQEAQNLDHQKLSQAWKAKEALEQEREELMELLCLKEIKATWKNPETQEEKEIILNPKKEISFFQEFYQKYLGISLNPKEIRSIFRSKKNEIQAEMETYGYDQILIIPENLPENEILNKKLIETMEEEVIEDGEKIKKKVEETYQSDDFKKRGSWKEAKSIEKPKTRLVLVHSSQNIEDHPILKATREKNIPQLVLNISDRDWEEIKRRGEEKKYEKDALDELKKGTGINIDLKIGNQTVSFRLQAEGLSMEEYLLFQRIFFEKNQKHLDESGWTWLLKSIMGSRVAHALWHPFIRQLYARAYVPVHRSDLLGVRPSRSFSKS